MKRLLILAALAAMAGFVWSPGAEAHHHRHHHQCHHWHHAHHHHHGHEQESLFTTDMKPYFDVREDHPGDFGPYYPDNIWPNFHHWNHM